MKRVAHYHPAVFLIASLLFLYRMTSSIAGPEQIVRPMVLLLGVLGLLAWPAVKVAGDREKAAWLLTVGVLGLCANWRFILLVGLVVGVAVVPRLLGATDRVRRPSAAQVNELLGAIGVLLVVVLAGSIAWGMLFIPALKDVGRPIPHSVRSGGSRPDVYLMVLDGYARADVLVDLYRFDNSDLVHFLESRGFTVPAKSRSNYAKTVLSVASMLNMDYMEAIEPGLRGSHYWWLMSRYINHSRVSASFEQLGYRTVALATDWGITDIETADEYVAPRVVMSSDFEYYLLGLTPIGVFGPLLSNVAFVRSNESHRELIRFTFHALREVAASPGPKFVFAHIVAPHPPFVFDAEGASVEPGYGFAYADGSNFPWSVDRYREGYLRQVQFVNKQLKTLIDDILRSSTIPPVILLQADHGPGMWSDFTSTANTCLGERFAAFCAFHLPGVDAHAVPEDVTPVDLFRIVLNQYYFAELPLLPRVHYYSEESFGKYRSEDVTSRVDTCTVPLRRK